MCVCVCVCVCVSGVLAEIVLADPTGEIIPDSSIFAQQRSIIFFGFGPIFPLFLTHQKGVNLLKQIETKSVLLI